MDSPEYHVQIQPSGHTFRAASQETLLEAALRSGINLNYHCNSGSCGECRVRLLSGQLGAGGFQDYHFTAAEKSQGYILLCTSHAASDLVIVASEATSAADIPLQSIQARIAKIEAVSELQRILHLRTPRTQTLRFLAGQHVRLTLPGVGSIDCSIASCPCNGMQLQFHLRYEAGDPFIEHLFTGALRSGDNLVVEGPFGEVTLDDDSRRPLLMVAVENGFAPIKSLLEHAVNLDLPQPVRFIWYAEEGRHFLLNHCRAWGEALDDYRFVPLSGEAPLDVTPLVAVIGHEVQDLADFDVYLAAPQNLLPALQDALVARGADAARLFTLQQRHLPRLVQQATGS